ncbi:MAG: extracellular solute-binding protein, partial [Acholeplasmataceae bacterium]|nr:extracellular solute-binding protein [Acholeplasmataceae bacterium]
MIKRVLGLFLVLLLGFVLIACEESEKETEELNVVIAGLSQPQERVFFTTFVRLFEARYDAKVNVTYTVEGDLRQKIETEQTANNVVTDVVMVHSSALNAYINNDWMVDLTSVVAGFEERTITDIFDTETTREGKTYFIPINFDVYISIYNVAALPYIPSTVDVTRNTSDQITQINHITWEEYAEWAIAIADATETPKSGFPMATTGSQLLYPMGGMALA